MNPPSSGRPVTAENADTEDKVVFAGELSPADPLRLLLRRIFERKEVEHGLLQIKQASGSAFMSVGGGAVVKGAFHAATGSAGMAAVKAILGIDSGAYTYFSLTRPEKALAQDLALPLDFMFADADATPDHSFEALSAEEGKDKEGKEKEVAGRLNSILQEWQAETVTVSPLPPPPLPEQPAVSKEKSWTLDQLSSIPTPKIDSSARRQVEQDLERALSGPRPDSLEALPAQPERQAPVPAKQPSGYAESGRWKRKLLDGSVEAEPGAVSGRWRASEPRDQTVSARIRAIDGQHLFSDEAQASTGGQLRARLAVLVIVAALACVILFPLVWSVVCSRNASAHFVEGVQYLKANDPNKAVVQFDACIKSDPKFPNAHLWRALCLGLLDDPEKAIADYDLAVSFQPTAVDAYAGRAAQYLKVRNYEDAIKDCGTVLKLDPANRNALLMRATAEMKELDFRAAAGDCLDYLQDNLAADKNERALAWGLLGLIYRHDGQMGKALDAYKQATAMNGRDANLLVGRAECYAQQHEWRLALKDCNHAVALNRNIDIYRLRATALVGLGQGASALHDLEAALKRDPLDRQAYNLRARVKFDMQDYQGALNDYQAVLDSNPQDKEALEGYKRAWSHMPHRQLQALAFEEEARLQGPKKLKESELVQQGYTQLQQGAVWQAVPTLTAAVRANPSDPLARRYLAHAFALSGQPRLAVEQFLAAGSLMRLQPEDLLAMAKAFSCDNQLAQSADQYQLYLNAKPDDLNARLAAIDVCERGGMKERGLKMALDGLAVTRIPGDRELLEAIARRLQAPAPTRSPTPARL